MNQRFTEWFLVLLAGSVLLGTLPALGTPKKRVPKERTPISVVKEAAKRFNEQDLAWQFYSDYATYFYGYSQQYGAMKVRTKSQLALRQQWAVYFKRLGDMVVEMRDLKKQKDGIRRNDTNVPFSHRKKFYDIATVKHRQILSDFVTRAKRPPKQQMSLTSAEKGRRR